jgi:hypothetical protein
VAIIEPVFLKFATELVRVSDGPPVKSQAELFVEFFNENYELVEDDTATMRLKEIAASFQAKHKLSSYFLDTCKGHLEGVEGWDQSKLVVNYRARDAVGKLVKV